MLNPVNLKGFLLLVLVAVTVSLSAQALPRIEARFNNPVYDRASRTYFLDLELNSKDAPEILYSMGLRFFYDASLMEFQKMDQFHQGYAVSGNAPTDVHGNDQSGQQLFDFSHAAAYVSGLVSWVDERFPLQIKTNSWVKVLRVSFKVPVTILNKANFCPSVILDLQQDYHQGGFIGSAGLVITVADDTRRSRYSSAPTIPSIIPFNWKYSAEPGMPFGKIVSSDCVPVGEVISIGEGVKTDPKGFALFQNQPNPFDERTFIEFILPVAQHANIFLYDVDGVVKEVIEGDYTKGRNQVELKQKPWMTETGIIYYRLQTDTYTSRTFAMTLVRA